MMMLVISVCAGCETAFSACVRGAKSWLRTIGKSKYAPASIASITRAIMININPLRLPPLAM
jgi:hypothetical protein